MKCHLLNVAQTVLFIIKATLNGMFLLTHFPKRPEILAINDQTNTVNLTLTLIRVLQLPHILLCR